MCRPPDFQQRSAVEYGRPSFPAARPPVLVKPETLATIGTALFQQKNNATFPHAYQYDGFAGNTSTPEKALPAGLFQSSADSLVVPRQVPQFQPQPQQRESLSSLDFWLKRAEGLFRPENAVTVCHASNAESDEKKRKRVMSNRESAKRSRERRVSHMKELEDETGDLLNQNKELSRKLVDAVSVMKRMDEEKQALVDEVKILRKSLKQVNETKGRPEPQVSTDSNIVKEVLAPEDVKYLKDREDVRSSCSNGSFDGQSGCFDDLLLLQDMAGTLGEECSELASDSFFSDLLGAFDDNEILY